MRFWADDIEAMRPEARACVAAHVEALRAAYNDRPPFFPDLDRFARARAVRASLPEFPPHPAGVDREIDGVPCRVFRPSVPARAVIVHLHGGGMVLGAPVMNDAGNAALAERHGVDTRLELYPVPTHDFHIFWSFLPEAAEAVQQVGRFAKERRVRSVYAE